MGEHLALVEMLLVFVVTFGWGLYELWSLRREKRKRERDPSAR